MTIYVRRFPVWCAFSLEQMAIELNENNFLISNFYFKKEYKIL